MEVRVGVWWREWRFFDCCGFVMVVEYTMKLNLI